MNRVSLLLPGSTDTRLLVETKLSQRRSAEENKLLTVGHETEELRTFAVSDGRRHENRKHLSSPTLHEILRHTAVSFHRDACPLDSSIVWKSEGCSLTVKNLKPQHEAACDSQTLLVCFFLAHLT